MLPSIEKFHQLAEQHGLQVIDTLPSVLITRTLLEWRKAFMEKLAEVKSAGI
jgi:hypothetical protein